MAGDPEVPGHLADDVGRDHRFDAIEPPEVEEPGLLVDRSGEEDVRIEVDGEWTKLRHCASRGGVQH